MIDRCLGGDDPEAWESFVVTHADLIWSSIHKTFGLFDFRYEREDAEDLFNSILLSLIENDFKKLRQFRGDNNCTLSTWLCVVAGRMAIDRIRRDKNHLMDDLSGDSVTQLEKLADPAPSAGRALIDMETDRQLKGELERLQTRDRLIYELLFVRECSADEASEILGISAGLVYSRKHRIIRKMKKLLLEV